MTDLSRLKNLARGAFNARNGIGPEAADWNSRAHANEAFHRAFEDPMTVLALIDRAKSADSYRNAANVFEHDFGVMRDRVQAAERERDEASAELGRVRRDVQRVFDRCTTAVALGVQCTSDSYYGDRASLAEELLEDIEGSPALEGLEYDDQERDEGR